TATRLPDLTAPGVLRNSLAQRIFKSSAGALSAGEMGFAVTGTGGVSSSTILTISWIVLLPSIILARHSTLAWAFCRARASESSTGHAGLNRGRAKRGDCAGSGRLLWNTDIIVWRTGMVRPSHGA